MSGGAKVLPLFLTKQHDKFLRWNDIKKGDA